MDHHHHDEKRRIWITGASSGIGYALAERLAGQGDSVAISARSEGKLNELASASSNIAAYPLDVTEQKRVHEVIEAIEADGAIDIAVLNAGAWALMDADEMAVHFAVDNSGATKKGLLELGFTSQRAIYPLSDDYVDGADSKVKWRDTNHKFTAKIVRSDLTFEKEAASITLGGGTDFQISIKDLTSD
ncbi:SDR family oxidoreductase, partial [uncultured Maritalea sp.]|uniref:SDR family NAD(P)-dependent oxidoreductase n=1 Tax=uncultured Maritalea sp. TaxID=757249 RepID=UPI002613466C